MPAKSEDIIRDIDQIYAKYHIMPQLAVHMKRVAGICAFILDHWQGPKVCRADIIAAALTHDLGNIVKVDLDGDFAKEFMGEEYKNVAEWKKKKAHVTKTYGTNEHTATFAKLKELGAPERLKVIIEGARFANNEKTEAGDDWDAKILCHADHIVSPKGIVTLTERIKEGGQRHGYDNSSPNSLVQAAFTLEKQIAAQITLPMEAITEDAILPYMKPGALLTVTTADEDDDWEDE